MINSEGTAAGTYLHGIFDHGGFLRGFLKPLMEKYHLEAGEGPVDINAYKEVQYDKLAELVRKSMDIEKIYEMMGGKPDV